MPPTVTQLKVLALLALGMDLPQIARDMQISVTTARGHLRTILERLDATNGTHAVAVAIGRGLLPLNVATGGSDVR
jgi:DNA-binding NarL/FixJ family response regulator